MMIDKKNFPLFSNRKLVRAKQNMFKGKRVL
jgi:hypothetical protein